MKQTAVEWLEEKMKTWGDLPRWMRDDIVEQSKEMEKEQIIEAWFDGTIEWDLEKDAEQYYKEKFKSE